MIPNAIMRTAVSKTLPVTRKRPGDKLISYLKNAPNNWFNILEHKRYYNKKITKINLNSNGIVKKVFDVICKYGSNVIKDYCQKAADVGNSNALCKLGQIHCIGTMKEYKKAVEYFKLAVHREKNPNPEACSYLCLCYLKGQGVEKNVPLAMEYFQKAVNHMKFSTQFCLGSDFNCDKIKENLIESIKLMEPDLEKNKNLTEWIQNFKDTAAYRKEFMIGVESFKEDTILATPEAQNNLGVCYFSGEEIPQDYIRAVEYFKKAEKSSPDAQTNLGLCHFYGHGVNQDYSKAVEYFKKGAELSRPEALYALALCYENGQGVLRDTHKSGKYLQLAASSGSIKALELLAREGDPIAQNDLGIEYYTGKKVEKDLVKAINLYRKAHAQGLINATYNLGHCLWYSRVAENRVQAEIYVRMAASQKIQQAKDFLKNVIEPTKQKKKASSARIS